MKTVVICCLMACTATAQKKTYDLISYTLPSGWQEEESTGGMQLSVHKDGEYAVAVILKAIASDFSPEENFRRDWEKLVKGTVNLEKEVEMQEAVQDKGWEIYSGTASYIDGKQRGLATLLTASGGGKAVSMVLLTNTARYQQDLLDVLNSLEIQEATTATTTLAGLWVDYLNETFGSVPSYSGGYFRQEYLLKPNGEYVYRMKNYAVLQKDILYNYEKGTYTLTGNTLILQPSEGRAERWSKGPAGKWGEKRSSEKTSLSPKTYRFLTESKTGENYLRLEPGNLTFKAYTTTLIDDPPLKK